MEAGPPRYQTIGVYPFLTNPEMISPTKLTVKPNLSSGLCYLPAFRFVPL